MMIPGFVTIIIIEVSYVWQKKIRSAQNVTDVSFFVVFVVKGYVNASFDNDPDDSKSQSG